MKETTWRPIAGSEVDDVPLDQQRHFDAVGGRYPVRSEIVWGEHCSECSFPTCQSTCAFYTPMPDLICQRFANGIQDRLTAAGTALKFIEFRKWGKLEGRGNAMLATADGARRLDWLDRRVAAILRYAPMPFRLRGSLIHHWNVVKGSMFRSGAIPATSFVIEAWSSSPVPARFSATFLQSDGNGMFQHGFEISSRHAVVSIAIGDIARQIDLDRDFLVQIEPIGDAEGLQVVFGVIDFVADEALPPARRSDRPAQSSKAMRAKVVVWDLDNTLWNGTLAETGRAGIALRPEIVQVIEELDRRGILNSIASKNDEGEALAALEDLGLGHLFLHPQVSWNPKSDAIATIAKRLDLGVDSFVFVDDQAFERGEVAAAYPMITTLSELEALDLPTSPLTDVPVTAESGARRALYKAEGARAISFERSGADYVAFLASCEIRLTIRELTIDVVDRVYELSQRTNQLNFRGTKFAREQVVGLIAEAPAVRSWVLHCADVFGDYGIIGFGVVDMATGTLTDFFMSCRVQRKCVENAFFAHLLDTLAATRHDRLHVRYEGTARNAASVRMLADLGFTAHSAGGTVWTIDATAAIPLADLVKISGTSIFGEARHDG